MLVPLLAPLAPSFRIDVFEINDGEQPTCDWQGGEETQQTAAGSNIGQGTREGIKASTVHGSSSQDGMHNVPLTQGPAARDDEVVS